MASPCPRGAWLRRRTPSGHNSDNSSCCCSKCCGRGGWAEAIELQDPWDEEIEKLDSGNIRRHVQVRWLQDQLAESRSLLAATREAATREAATREAATREAAPRHAHWLASLRGCDPRQLSCASTPCAWHDDADVYNNVAVLPCVVGEYNQILNESQLDGLLTHLEVTLFRNGRFRWCFLQERIRSLLRAGQLVLLCGKPRKNKWIHVNCVQCGKAVFVKYDMAGSSRAVTPEDHGQRRKLFEFFRCPVRPLDSNVLPEV